MNPYITQRWISYLRDIGLQEELLTRYVEYIEVCVKNGVPPIFEQVHLAKLTGRNTDDLMAMVFGTESFYREFRLRKRSGGFRKIRAPYPSLLEVQRWINEEILSKRKLPNCVTGFREGYSILDNARMHCGRDEIIKIDIKDFFPSINFKRVMSTFISLGYPVNVSFFLSRLCTLDNELPQGAATSPALSNIICSNLDKRFYKLCRSRRLRYTRYADDITISGKSIPDGLAKLFFEIIESEGFKANETKTRYYRSGEKKIVTGLDISTGKPRVTRSYRRDIQKDVYFVWSAGLSTHVARRKIFAPNYIRQLEGRVRFWESIEPESRQMKRTLQRVMELRLLYG
ncbi:reverse transcriptase family protein [Defluviimonas sp. WL0075]|uniref:RNA-directed DNA polymerase n=1 Tax=Albidovulum sediminicola TaxID=2984331 RepID=A0ABT2Z773_9RHOB|nr:reverse transcriptase family protein [Defluviimonas sp. WL0075]MCV2866942.1 reverse transcriptase family protein [Defluviimonas sp. WL0075]